MIKGVMGWCQHPLEVWEHTALTVRVDGAQFYTHPANVAFIYKGLMNKKFSVR